MGGLFEFLVSESGMALIGLVIGGIHRSKAQQYEMMLGAITAKDDSRDKAAARTKDGGTWMRRALYFLMLFVFVTVLLAPFFGESVAVEQEVTKGILFWKKVVIEIVEIQAVLFPVEIRTAFLAFIGYYLGQGTK